jgi:hypothetical protein
MVWHRLIGKNHREENINLCGRPGAGITIRRSVTCNKCRAKMHMRKLRGDTKWVQT